MRSSPAARRFAPTALMLGNIVTGCAVLAPAGMLKELSEGLDVSIRTLRNKLHEYNGTSPKAEEEASVED